MKMTRRLSASLALWCLLGGSAFAAPAITWTAYEYGNNQLAMTAAPIVTPANAFCGLLVVQGNFSSNWAQAFLRTADTQWQALVRSGSSGANMYVVAGCDLYSRFRSRTSPLRAHFWSDQAWEPYWIFDIRRVTYTSNGTHVGFYQVPMWGNDAVCYLTGAQGYYNGGGEYAWLRDGVAIGQGQSFLDVLNSTRISGSGTAGDMECVALHPGVYQPRYVYTVTQGQAPVQMIADAAGTCFLAGITGRFRGGGEEVGIYSSGGYQWLYARSMQVGVAAQAVCIPY